MQTIVHIISVLASKPELEYVLQSCSELCFEISQHFNDSKLVDRSLVKMLELVEKQMNTSEHS